MIRLRPQARGRRWGPSRTAIAGRRVARRFLRLIDGVLGVFLSPFLRPRFRVVTVAVALLVVIWSVGPTRSAVEAVMAAAERPLRERAAFHWQERFQDGLPAWIHRSTLSLSDSGEVQVRGLALHAKSMTLKEYDMGFLARLDRKSIGWVVRASSPTDYYVFKLIERGRSPEGARFDLVRYPVLNGVPGERETVQVVVIGAKADLNVSVRVSEDQIVTLVNGFGVDICKHPVIKSGGVGFFAENGESFRVRSLTISGNEDSLGLLLRKAEETLRSMRRVSDPVPIRSSGLLSAAS